MENLNMKLIVTYKSYLIFIFFSISTWKVTFNIKSDIIFNKNKLLHLYNHYIYFITLFTLHSEP